MHPGYFASRCIEGKDASSHTRVVIVGSQPDVDFAINEQRRTPDVGPCLGVSQLNVPYSSAGEHVDCIDMGIWSSVVGQVSARINRYRGTNNAPGLRGAIELPDSFSSHEIEGEEGVTSRHVDHAVINRWSRPKRKVRIDGPLLSQLGHILCRDISFRIHPRSG